MRLALHACQGPGQTSTYAVNRTCICLGSGAWHYCVESSLTSSLLGSKLKFGGTRRYSVSSDEHDEIEASTASLDPSTEHHGAGRGASRSPLVRAKSIANKLKDSLISTGSTSSQPETVWNARNNYAQDTQLLFKRKITRTYVLATSLRSYVELNYAGFRKILKKYAGPTVTATFADCIPQVRQGDR